jgi:hypothetical protein
MITGRFFVDMLHRNFTVGHCEELCDEAISTADQETATLRKLRSQ